MQIISQIRTLNISLNFFKPDLFVRYIFTMMLSVNLNIKCISAIENTYLLSDNENLLNDRYRQTFTGHSGIDGHQFHSCMVHTL